MRVSPLPHSHSNSGSLTRLQLALSVLQLIPPTQTHPSSLEVSTALDDVPALFADELALAPCEGLGAAVVATLDWGLGTGDWRTSDSRRPGITDAGAAPVASPQSPVRQVHSKSSARFSAGAECVRAPIEMRSTPVSAIARTVPSVTPPLASVTL